MKVHRLLCDTNNPINQLYFGVKVQQVIDSYCVIILSNVDLTFISSSHSVVHSYSSCKNGLMRRWSVYQQGVRGVRTADSQRGSDVLCLWRILGCCFMWVNICALETISSHWSHYSLPCILNTCFPSSEHQDLPHTMSLFFICPFA